MCKNYDRFILVRGNDICLCQTASADSERINRSGWKRSVAGCERYASERFFPVVRVDIEPSFIVEGWESGASGGTRNDGEGWTVRPGGMENAWAASSKRGGKEGPGRCDWDGGGKGRSDHSAEYVFNLYFKLWWMC